MLMLLRWCDKKLPGPNCCCWRRRWRRRWPPRNVFICVHMQMACFSIKGSHIQTRVICHGRVLSSHFLALSVSATGHSRVPGHYTEKEEEWKEEEDRQESFFFLCASAYIALAELCCKCELSGKLMASHQIARMSEHSNRINHKIGCSSSSSANATGMYH